MFLHRNLLNRQLRKKISHNKNKNCQHNISSPHNINFPFFNRVADRSNVVIFLGKVDNKNHAKGQSLGSVNTRNRL